MRFREEQLDVVRRLSAGAKVYQNFFLRKPEFREQFNDNYVALQCFLDNYAHERQGAARAYPRIATTTIERIFDGKLNSVAVEDAGKAWSVYKEIAKADFDNLKLNEKRNPMFSDAGILKVMATQKVSNIANHARTLITDGKTRYAHRFMESIRGIGTKIASFYLRDIAYLSGLKESTIKDQYCLQPVDTWLGQTLSIIFGDNAPTGTRNRQKVIVELSIEANCSPISFNQGAWVFGSQVAGDFKTFRKIAEGDNPKSIVKSHLLERQKYVDEIRKLLTNM